MSYIPQIDYDTALDEIRAAHDEEVRVRGRMTNMKRTLLHSPAAHQSTRMVHAARRARLDRRPADLGLPMRFRRSVTGRSPIPFSAAR